MSRRGLEEASILIGVFEQSALQDHTEVLYC